MPAQTAVQAAIRNARAFRDRAALGRRRDPGDLSIGPGISSSAGGTSTPTTAIRRFSAR